MENTSVFNRFALDVAVTEARLFFKFLCHYRLDHRNEMWVRVMLCLLTRRQIAVIKPPLFAWSTSAFLSDFYRRVNLLLSEAETVQWAEGTRWHGRVGGRDHILLQSGNKARQKRWSWVWVCCSVGLLGEKATTLDKTVSICSNHMSMHNLSTESSSHPLHYIQPPSLVLFSSYQITSSSWLCRAISRSILEHPALPNLPTCP